MDKIPLKISLSAIDAIMRSESNETFVKDLIAISNGTFNPLVPNCVDSAAQAALDIIQRESKEAHEKRSMAGRNSAKSRLGARVTATVAVPEIIVPKMIPSTEILGKTIPPLLVLQIRYIMLAHDYASSEYLVFLRYTLKNSRDTSADELRALAQSWSNYQRGCRFPSCPKFHEFLVCVMNEASAIERGFLLDSSLDVKIEDCMGKIIGSESAINILLKKSELFDRIVKPVYPSVKFEKSIVAYK